jgi:hypothetical protein
MATIRNNNDLYLFIKELEEIMLSNHSTMLAERLGQANRFFSGSSSEYLHEAEETLKAILGANLDFITNDKQEEIRIAVQLIDKAFNDIGGA